jgi:hypothetical protein
MNPQGRTGNEQRRGNEAGVRIGFAAGSASLDAENRRIQPRMSVSAL